MSSLINTLKSRTTSLARKTRDRSVDVLGKVRSGTLDWHRTLEARRAELDAATAPKWFQLGGLQIFVIDRFDRALNAFGDRVRGEIHRLQHLELHTANARVGTTYEPPKAPPASAKPAEAKSKAKPSRAKAASARAKPKPAAKKATAARKATAAKKATAKTVAAVSETPVSVESKTSKRKARPAAKRATKATRNFVMPIVGYDELTAKEVLGEVPRLTPTQCETVRGHEASHKKRKTVLAALDARLAA